MNAWQRFGGVDLGKGRLKWPSICCVCHRRAGAGGFSPPNSKLVLWLCENPECIEPGKEVFKMAMRMKGLDHFEQEARDAAGDEAGAYLESVGMADTPPGEWPAEVWKTFLSKIVLGFEENMRKIILKARS